MTHEPPAPVDSADFDGEIALAFDRFWLARGRRPAHSRGPVYRGRRLSDAERNRQRAREQFIEANDLFRQFQEMRAPRPSPSTRRRRSNERRALSQPAQTSPCAASPRRRGPGALCRITVADARAPVGRARPIRLSDRDVDQLVDFALQLEANR